MKMETGSKSTVAEIRERFDKDVERFSNLETGQQTTVDSPLCLELIAEAAKATNPGAKNILDIGCGAGNYTLKILSRIPDLNCTLIDLSLPMLERSAERVGKETKGSVETIQTDIREASLKKNHYDIVVSASVFHHLRNEEDWELVFTEIFNSVKPGGSFWIFDLILHDTPQINDLFTERFAAYLEGLGGTEFREKVFAYIAKEDTPRSLNYQTSLLEKTGFTNIEILHKNLCFAAFGAIKPLTK